MSYWNCSPGAPPDLFIVCVHFLKVNESLFYKETVESFYPESFQIYTFYSVSFNLKLIMLSISNP